MLLQCCFDIVRRSSGVQYGFQCGKVECVVFRRIVITSIQDVCVAKLNIEEQTSLSTSSSQANDRIILL